MSKKAVVGMSGGVDSAVTAYLLREQGYEVVGATILTGRDEDAAAVCQPQAGGEAKAIKEAQNTCEVLKIKHTTVDFKSQFNNEIMEYFVSEYVRGCTPNPCIACNRYVKWKALLLRADELGAEYIATGHYAKITKLDNGRYSIRNAVTAAKDQTYALYGLSQEQLARTLMPVGDYGKEEIRRIAERLGLAAAHAKDSQDICFVPDHDYASFILRKTGMESRPGSFVDEDGRVLGEHRGLIHYTIGQRKGLGISAETPLFVKELRPETNEVVLCRSEALFARECLVADVNYMAVEALEEPTPAIGKIRYSHRGAPCVLWPNADGSIRCRFEEPQRAMTPGQAAVFYRMDYILCGGVITKDGC